MNTMTTDECYQKIASMELQNNKMYEQNIKSHEDIVLIKDWLLGNGHEGALKKLNRLDDTMIAWKAIVKVLMGLGAFAGTTNIVLIIKFFLS